MATAKRDRSAYNLGLDSLEYSLTSHTKVLNTSLINILSQIIALNIPKLFSANYQFARLDNQILENYGNSIPFSEHLYFLNKFFVERFSNRVFCYIIRNIYLATIVFSNLDFDFNCIEKIINKYFNIFINFEKSIQNSIYFEQFSNSYKKYYIIKTPKGFCDEIIKRRIEPKILEQRIQKIDDIIDKIKNDPMKKKLLEKLKNNKRQLTIKITDIDDYELFKYFSNLFKKNKSDFYEILKSRYGEDIINNIKLFFYNNIKSIARFYIPVYDVVENYGYEINKRGREYFGMIVHILKNGEEEIIKTKLGETFEKIKIETIKNIFNYFWDKRKIIFSLKFKPTISSFLSKQEEKKLYESSSLDDYLKASQLKHDIMNSYLCSYKWKFNIPIEPISEKVRKKALGQVIGGSI